MPAAEPGHVQRPRRVPLRRAEAHLPQADRHLLPGAARPRALHLVRALHALLRPDRRRPVHRAARPRLPPADRRRQRGPAVQLLLLRQHRPDLPGRRAHRHGVPVPLPALRPGVDARRPASTARPAAPCAPTTAAAWSCDGWPATTPRSTRSGTATRAVGPSPTPSATTGSPSRWSATSDGALVAGVLAGGARRRGRGGSRPRGQPAASACSPAAGSTLEDAYAYGKFARVALGTNDVDFRARPHSAEEAAVPRRTSSPVAAPRTRHLRRPGDAAPVVLLVGPRARGGVADRLPAAAQGGPPHGTARRVGRAVRDPQPRQAAGGRCSSPARPGGEADALAAAWARRGQPRRPAAPASRGAVILVGRAARGSPRCAQRRGRAWPTPPVPGSPGFPGAPASAAPSRPARCRPCCPGGRPVADAAARVRARRGLGRRGAARPSRVATPRPSSAAAPTAARRAGRRRCRPGDLADPGPPRAALDAARLRGEPRAPRAARSPSVPTSSSRSRPSPRRPARSSTGRAAPGRSRTVPVAFAARRRRGAQRCSRTASGSTSGSPTTDAPRGELAGARSRWTGARADATVRSARPEARRTARRRSPPGTPLLDAGSLQDGEPISRAPPRPAARACARPTAAASAPAEGDLVDVARHGRSSACRPRSATCPTAWSGCPTNAPGCAVRRDLGVGAGRSVHARAPRSRRHESGRDRRRRRAGDSATTPGGSIVCSSRPSPSS